LASSAAIEEIERLRVSGVRPAMSRLRSSARAVASSSVRFTGVPAGSAARSGASVVDVERPGRCERSRGFARESLSRARSLATACAAAGRVLASTRRHTQRNERMKPASSWVLRRKMKLPATAAVVARLLLQHHELHALIGRQPRPHPEQLIVRDLFNSERAASTPDCAYHWASVAGFDHLVEVGFRLVERASCWRSTGHRFLEDRLDFGALLLG